MKHCSPPRHGFTSIDHPAADIILSAVFNPSGNRIILCSADHRIRVYDGGPSDDWDLVDQWRGHDGEARWFGPSLGQVFGTIGGDNKLKIWREDPSQIPRGGRRFKLIFSQSPFNHVAYVAIDIKTVKAEAWVVLMTHDGLLSLLEPLEPESLSTWRETDAFYPCGQQPRSSEPKYGLSLQPTEMPCYDAICAGLDINALSLAVSATGTIKIIRALKADESGYQFYEMLEIGTESPQINDLAWAPGCIRPFDLVAAACDDGYVRVFKIITPHDASAGRAALSQSAQSAKTSTANTGTTPSGIGAGLAGVSRTATRQSTGAPRIRHDWQELASLQTDRKAVWKVRWMHDGSALVSTGDDGKAHLWRQSLNGDFIEFAETGPS